MLLRPITTTLWNCLLLALVDLCYGQGQRGALPGRRLALQNTIPQVLPNTRRVNSFPWNPSAHLQQAGVPNVGAGVRSGVTGVRPGGIRGRVRAGVAGIATGVQRPLPTGNVAGRRYNRTYRQRRRQGRDTSSIVVDARRNALLSGEQLGHRHKRVRRQAHTHKADFHPATRRRHVLESSNPLGRLAAAVANMDNVFLPHNNSKATVPLVHYNAILEQNQISASPNDHFQLTSSVRNRPNTNRDQNANNALSMGQQQSTLDSSNTGGHMPHMNTRTDRKTSQSNHPNQQRSLKVHHGVQFNPQYMNNNNPPPVTNPPLATAPPTVSPMFSNAMHQNDTLSLPQDRSAKLHQRKKLINLSPFQGPQRSYQATNPPPVTNPPMYNNPNIVTNPPPVTNPPILVQTNGNIPTMQMPSGAAGMRQLQQMVHKTQDTIGRNQQPNNMPLVQMWNGGQGPQTMPQQRPRQQMGQGLSTQVNNQQQMLSQQPFHQKRKQMFLDSLRTSPNLQLGPGDPFKPMPNVQQQRFQQQPHMQQNNQQQNQAQLPQSLMFANNNSPIITKPLQQPFNSQRFGGDGQLSNMHSQTQHLQQPMQSTQQQGQNDLPMQMFLHADRLIQKLNTGVGAAGVPNHSNQQQANAGQETIYRAGNAMPSQSLNMFANMPQNTLGQQQSNNQMNNNDPHAMPNLSIVGNPMSGGPMNQPHLMPNPHNSNNGFSNLAMANQMQNRIQYTTPPTSLLMKPGQNINNNPLHNMPILLPSQTRTSQGQFAGGLALSTSLEQMANNPQIVKHLAFPHERQHVQHAQQLTNRNNNDRTSRNNNNNNWNNNGPNNNRNSNGNNNNWNNNEPNNNRNSNGNNNNWNNKLPNNNGGVNNNWNNIGADTISNNKGTNNNWNNNVPDNNRNSNGRNNNKNNSNNWNNSVPKSHNNRSNKGPKDSKNKNSNNWNNKMNNKQINDKVNNNFNNNWNTNRNKDNARTSNNNKWKNGGPKDNNNTNGQNNNNNAIRKDKGGNNLNTDSSKSKRPFADIQKEAERVKQELASMFTRLQRLLRKLNIIPVSTIRPKLGGPSKAPSAATAAGALFTRSHRSQNHFVEGFGPKHTSRKEALSNVRSSLQALGIPISVEALHQLDLVTAPKSPGAFGREVYNVHQLGPAGSLTDGRTQSQHSPVPSGKANSPFPTVQASSQGSNRKPDNSPFQPVNLWNAVPYDPFPTVTEWRTPAPTGTTVSTLAKKREPTTNNPAAFKAMMHKVPASFGGPSKDKKHVGGWNNQFSRNGRRSGQPAGVKRKTDTVMSPSSWLMVDSATNANFLTEPQGVTTPPLAIPNHSNKLNLHDSNINSVNRNTVQNNAHHKLRHLKSARSNGTTSKQHHKVLNAGKAPAHIAGASTLLPILHTTASPLQTLNALNANFDLQKFLSFFNQYLSVNSTTTNTDTKKNKKVNVTKTVRTVTKPVLSQLPILNEGRPLPFARPLPSVPPVHQQQGMASLAHQLFGGGNQAMPEFPWSMESANQQQTSLVSMAGNSKLNTTQAAAILKLLDALQTLQMAIGHSIGGSASNLLGLPVGPTPSVQIVLKVSDLDNRYVKLRCKCFPKNDGCPAELKEEPLLDMCDVQSTTPCCEDG